MIVLNETPDAPEWSTPAKTCRRCGEPWHTACPPLTMPDCVLGDN